MTVNKLIESVVHPLQKPEKINNGELWATHEGILNVGGMDIKCYILSNGLKIFDKDDIDRYLKMAELLFPQL